MITSNIYIEDILYKNFNQLGKNFDPARNKIYRLYNTMVQLDPRSELKIGYAIGTTLYVLESYNINISNWKQITEQEDLSNFNETITTLLSNNFSSVPLQASYKRNKKSNGSMKNPLLQWLGTHKNSGKKLII